ncbi:MAG: hypothetical protein ACHQ52_14685 [Candidatus Eisenbacteria bacterium]
MTSDLLFGRLRASAADVVDAGIDVLPHFEMAAITILEGIEHPGEFPEIRRRLRGEGIRTLVHRGALLLKPGDLERAVSAGALAGSDEIFLCEEWNEEFEPFPGRVAGDDFAKGTPLGLEEWMIDARCLLALGDATGVNFATHNADLDARLRGRFPAAKT